MTDIEKITEAEAKKTVKLVYEGKQLTKYVPKGQSPKLYIDLIKSQVLKPDRNGNPRSDSDLLMFLYVAKRTGLDPLTRQIHAVFRWDTRQGKEVMSIQVGIDGFRLVAQRTGLYAGQDDAKFLPEDEATEFPTKATVTVYKLINNERVPFTASARWAEYAPKSAKGEIEFMWKKMPYTMLGKVAEALALRKGFPNELSGIHTDDEMRQVQPTEAQQIAELPKPKVKEVVNNAISVGHGAPEDASQTPKVTPDNIDQFADKLVDNAELPTPEQFTENPGNEVEAPEKPVESMQDRVAEPVKARPTVAEMQKRLREMGKKAQVDKHADSTEN
jgi:phage recombination protein Bet